MKHLSLFLCALVISFSSIISVVDEKLKEEFCDKCKATTLTILRANAETEKWLADKSTLLLPQEFLLEHAINGHIVRARIILEKRNDTETNIQASLEVRADSNRAKSKEWQQAVEKVKDSSNESILQIDTMFCKTHIFTTQDGFGQPIEGISMYYNETLRNEEIIKIGFFQKLYKKLSTVASKISHLPIIAA